MGVPDNIMKIIFTMFATLGGCDLHLVEYFAGVESITKAFTWSEWTAEAYDYLKDWLLL